MTPSRATVLTGDDVAYSVRLTDRLVEVYRGTFRILATANAPLTGVDIPARIAGVVLLDALRDDEAARLLAPTLADELRADPAAWSKGRTEIQAWAAQLLKSEG